MGEDPRQGGAPVAEQGPRDPHEIREDIESTRRELGDTVEALAEKADVKGQAQQKVAEVKRSVSGKKDELIAKARRASPETAGSAASGAVEKARTNPLPVAAAGAFAAGLIIGRISKR
jgi:uncharacterized protein DUF3618